MRRLVAILAGAAAVAACASTDESGGLPPLREVPGSVDECVLLPTVDDWRALDRDSLLLMSAGRPRYRVDVAVCQSLELFETIRLVSHDARLCTYGGDAVVVDGTRCAIVRIVRVEPAED